MGKATKKGKGKAGEEAAAAPPQPPQVQVSRKLEEVVEVAEEDDGFPGGFGQ